MTALAVPELSLVCLVGASGSGKSTFAAAHFGPFEVLSSDFCRGLVSDDPDDQSATAAAFEVLHHIAGKRLDAGRLTVVDATNVQPEARRSLVALAREHDVLPVAIVLDLPERVCLDRNAARPDRAFGDRVVKRQRDQLRRSLRSLRREGFRTVHVLGSEQEVSDAVVVREKLLTDLRDRPGPFDVVGDVHGCRAELEQLLDQLGYGLLHDEAGRPVDAVPPPGRTAVFVGDLVDRGPDSPGVLRLVMGMVAAGHALAVPGNHESKLVKALQGRDVQVSHGLEETLVQLGGETAEFRTEVEQFCHGLVSHLVLDGGRLVVAHAGLLEKYHGRSSARVRSFALYGDTTGETDEFGLPVRYPWAQEYRGAATVLYGHTPTPEPEWVNGTMCLDTGAVFGGHLTALRYPEKELVQVPAQQVWYEPVRPFPAAGPSGGVAAATVGTGRTAGTGGRGHDDLAITDVLGARGVETRLAGRVTVREDNAAGALEVMSRFAMEPRWLLYLPPTMAPSATAPDGDLLEHPAAAFDFYATGGITRLVCEEKHMGSRAVALVCRDAGVARTRFGATDGASGAVHTRTGALSSTATSPSSCSPGCATRWARPVCGRSSTPTGCSWTRSCCPGPPRPRPCCATSTPPWVPPLARRSPPPSTSWSGSPPAPPTAVPVPTAPTSATCSLVPARVRRTRGPTPRRTAATSGPPTA
jgi:protein phosphatase